ncbi:MAG: aminopeptidase P family N-terminal domain-containing protein [Bryobacteraceae bacterium]
MSSRSRRHRLIEIDWPQFGVAACPPRPPASELQARIDNLRAKMEERGFTHAVVYGDREHFANLAYLTGFDPRFEESLLIVGKSGTPLILVGNECEAYLGISSLHSTGLMRHELFQTFSLLGQPRERSRALREILAEEGIGPAATVGAIGYKYFAEPGHLDIPSYIADTLRNLAGPDKVLNAADLLMHPGYGLRAKCSPFEIAAFEYTNCQAAEAATRMIFALREGMTDHAAVEAARLNGEPLSCHLTFVTGGNVPYGLCGPSGEIVRRGQPLAFNIAYWGSNICRAGWIAESAADLPPAASDYVSSFAGPYFEALGEWFGMMKLGTPGHAVHSLIQARLPFEKFGIYLNPGHLIHLDEWMSSPFYAGSEIPVASGMAIQVDVIPSSPQYFSTRMEDGIVIADAELRRQLKECAPDCYDRCQKRRSFMTDVLGIELPEEVLPLSNTCAIVPPFFLKPNTVLALDK